MCISCACFRLCSFPRTSTFRAYSQGIDGILIAACGSDCPYHGAYDRLAARIDRLTSRMNAGGLGIERIRLTAICTVCIKAFLKEVALMSDHLQRLGPVDRKLAERLAARVPEPAFRPRPAFRTSLRQCRED